MLKVPETEAKLEFEHPDCFAQYNAMNSIQHYHPDIQKEYNYYQAYAFPKGRYNAYIPSIS